MAHLVESKTADNQKNLWGTSLACFADATYLYGQKFLFDVCATKFTTKCGDCYFGPDQSNPDFTDALIYDWPMHWWCNPPFDQKVAFIQHAAKQVSSGMMLLPYEPLTAWWRNLVAPNALVIFEPDGRYNFVEPDGVTKKSGVNFGSAFVLFHSAKVMDAQRVPFQRGIGKVLLENTAA